MDKTKIHVDPELVRDCVRELTTKRELAAVCLVCADALESLLDGTKRYPTLADLEKTLRQV